MAPIDLLEENSIEAANTHYESANIHILNNSTSSNQNETTRTTQPSETTNNYLLKYNKNLNSTPANNMSYDDACLNDSNNNSDLILKGIHLKLNGSNKSLNIDTSSSNNNSETLNGHSHDNSNNLVNSDRDAHKPNDLYEQQQQQPQPALLDNVYETYDEFDEENISSSSLSSSSLSPLSDAHSNRTNPNSNVSNCSSRDENDEPHSAAPQALNLFKLDMNSTSMNKLAKDDKNDDDLGETCTNLIDNVCQSVVSINELSDSNEKSEDGGSCISDSLTPTPTPNTNSQERFVEFANELTINKLGLVKPKAETAQPAPPSSLALRTNLNTNETESSQASSATSAEQSLSQTGSPQQAQFIAQPPIYAAPGLVTYPSLVNTPIVYHGLPPATVPSNQPYMSYSHPNLHLVQPPYPSSAIQSPTSPLITPDQQPQSSTSIPTASSSTIYVHVDAGHIFQVHLGDKCKEILGPATVKIVSNDSTQPFPLQLTTPAPGQLVQQILNENGMLTHLIISSQQSAGQYQQHSQSQQASTTTTTTTTSSVANANSASIPTYCPYQVQHMHNPNLSYTQQTYALPQAHYQQQQQQTTQNYHHTQYNNHLNSYHPNYHHHHHHHHHSQAQFYNNQYPNNKHSKNSTVPTPSQSPQPQPYQSDNIQPVTYKQSTSPASNQSFDADHSLNSSKTEESNSVSDNNNNTQNSQITPVQVSSQSISPSSLSSCSSTSASVSTSSSISISSNKPLNKDEDTQQFVNQNAEFVEPNDFASLKQKLKNKPIKLNPYATLNAPYNPNFNNRLKETKYFNNKKYNSSLNRAQLIENNNNNKKFYINNNLSSSFSNNNRLANYNNNNPAILQQNRVIYHNNRSNPAFIAASINQTKPNKPKYNSYYNQNDSSPPQYQQQQYPSFNKTSSSMDELRVNPKPPQPDEEADEDSQDEIIVEINTNLDFYKSLLSKIKEPIVCDIESRSVLVRLSPIELDNQLITGKDETESDNNNKKEDDLALIPSRIDTIIKSFDYLNYTLELASESNAFNKVYTGDANEITLKDLKPNTAYSLRVHASLSSKCRGSYTNVVSFQTLSCAPDQPTPPKLTGMKKKNELTLRWANPNDNGAKITNFTLEYQEVSSYSEEQELNNTPESNDLSSFVQIYKGPLKQFTVKKLTPATCYAFRLSAENSLGASEFSKPVLIYTSSSVPNAPEPPQLVEACVSSLLLSWGPKRANETDYELQMLDGDEASSSSHGFLTVYNGSLLLYKVNELKRFSPYQFRLRARNEEGNSPWSDTRKYFTQADVPKHPLKLRAKVTQACIKVNWDLPKDDGGSKIISYCLEMAECDESEFRVVYEGALLEHSIEDKLKPGCVYSLRVNCSNLIGRSASSELVQFTTLPSFPGKCAPPKLSGKPKPNSTQIKWNYPDQDGGSAVTTYEVSLDGENAVVYKGNELVCSINSLQPGKNYSARVRCMNKVGAGEWSDPLEFTSGAGAPDAPQTPIVNAKSANLISISWLEPASNGSPVLEYRLEWSSKETELFSLLYSGLALKYELKGGVLPSTEYAFRVQAINANGASPFSPCAECTTPSSVPSMVSSIRIEEVQSDWLRISWKQPSSNGSPVLYYNLDFGESNSSAASYVVIHNQELVCEHRVESLQPDTVYKLRIQAANAMGVGQFSSLIKIRTKALPPTPPNLECVSTSYNSIKLKWTPTASSSSASSSDFIVVSSAASASSSKLSMNEIQYSLEMALDEPEPQFATVYQGALTLFKVNKLQESSAYLFRISAANETGQGKWSDLSRFSTTKSPPSINKPPTISELTQSSCLIEWLPAKLQTSLSKESSISSLVNEDQKAELDVKTDTLEYVLQLQAGSNSEYKEIYKGGACSFRLAELEPNTDYNVRVCAVRICNESRLCSPFSHHATFTTLKPSKVANSAKNSQNSVGSSQTLASSTEAKSGSLLSRLVWPSFYLSINSAQKPAKIASSNQKSQPVLSSSKNQAQLVKRRQQQQQQQTQQTNNNVKVNEDSADGSVKTSRSISDQQWAFILIFVLVLIAFLISYFVITIYQSYFEVEHS